MTGIVVCFAIIAVVVLGLLVREHERKVSAVEKYAGASPQLRADVIGGFIRMGMTEEQVIDSWGSPSRRTVQHLKIKTKTTLYFGRYRRAYLDNGQVIGWNTSSSRSRRQPITQWIVYSRTASRRRRVAGIFEQVGSSSARSAARHTTSLVPSRSPRRVSAGNGSDSPISNGAATEIGC